MINLDHIPEKIKRTFKAPFVFIVSENNYQHFPARNWKKADFLTALTRELGEDYELIEWQEQLIARSSSQDRLLILPEFPTILSFENKK